MEKEVLVTTFVRGVKRFLDRRPVQTQLSTTPLECRASVPVSQIWLQECIGPENFEDELHLRSIFLTMSPSLLEQALDYTQISPVRDDLGDAHLQRNEGFSLRHRAVDDVDRQQNLQNG